MPTLVFAIGVGIGWESTRRRLRAVPRRGRPGLRADAVRPDAARADAARLGGRTRRGSARGRRDRTRRRERRAAPAVRRWVLELPAGIRTGVPAALRGGAIAAAGVVAVASVLVAGSLVLSYAPIIGLYESVHTGVLGGVALTLGQLGVPAEPRHLGRVLAGRSRLRDRHGIRRLPARHPPRPAARGAGARRVARPATSGSASSGCSSRCSPAFSRRSSSAPGCRPSTAAARSARSGSASASGSSPASCSDCSPGSPPAPPARDGWPTSGRTRGWSGPSRRSRSASPPSPACSPCGRAERLVPQEEPAGSR